MKSLVSIIAMLSALAMHTLYSADAQKTLTIKTLTGHKFTIPFTDLTTITQVKEAIKESEGVPVDHQRLAKHEGWILGLPPKTLTTTLEDRQTCRQYDLQDNTTVYLTLRLPKSREAIEAEVKARRKIISDTLLPECLTQDPLGTIFAYDDYKKD